MNPALIEILRDIPTEEIDRLQQAENYSRWPYFTDAEAGQAGILYANDDSLALYYPADDTLKLGPAGIIKLQSLRYVPSNLQLNLEHSGQYLTLQVFSDPDQAEADTTTAQQWQQFLAGHSVQKLSVPAAGQSSSSGSRKKLIIAATAAAAVIIAIILI